MVAYLFRDKVWQVLLVIYALFMIIGRLIYNGLFFEMNYSVYQPDGLCYSKFAFEYSGYSKPFIQEALLDKYSNVSSDAYSNLNCDSVKARVLYPILSSIFVKNFGIEGMFVVPITSFLLVLLIMYRLLKYLQVSTFIATVTLILVTSSMTVQRWYISNLVDPLYYLIGALLISLLVRNKGQVASKHIPYLIILMILMGFTRRSFHIFWIFGLIILIGHIREFLPQMRLFWERANLFFVSKTILLFFILPFSLDIILRKLLGTQNGIWTIEAIGKLISNQEIQTDPGNVANGISVSLDEEYVERLFGVLVPILENAFSYIITTIGQLLIVDRMLFLVILVWLISLRTSFKEPTFQGLLSILAPMLVFLVSSLQGTLGTNLRFELVMLPCMILGLGLFLEKQRKLWSANVATDRTR